MATQPGPIPNPMLIFETLNGFQRSAALAGAIELDVFSIIAAGSTTTGQIASKCNASERGIRSLCDALVGIGLLRKNEAKYSLTLDTATFLDRRSPAFMGGAARFLCHPKQHEAWEGLLPAVKAGTSQSDEYATDVESEIWVDFAKGMAAFMMPAAQRIAELAGTAQPIRVLDIAASHGIYGIMVAKSSPQAEITALDWPHVLEVAKENARKFAVMERYKTIPGSFFEVDLGSGYDLALLTNFLHHFDRETCIGIIRKLKSALEPGGKIATVDFVMDDDRVTPTGAAWFSLAMLVGTKAGDSYTFAEFSQMFREAGFANTRRYEVMPGSPQSILISE
jgi:ubiquinone/menaquinone biosynthesis C-methylase UbiE/predicted transcriptional regulator